MKIDPLKIDSENFMVHQHFVGDEAVLLVQPNHIGAKWTRDTMIFRSSVWSLDGELISASFKKFVNWDEAPDLYPLPSSLKNAKLMEKLDGSTLIFSRWKGQTIIRTRGTVDARKQENGHEIDLLLAKYSKFFTWFEQLYTSDSSYIFEWTTPLNKIVIDYGVEADMVLIGAVNHGDYSYATQIELDRWANSLDLKRPRSFSYDSIDEMKAAVEAFKGLEGLCVYYQDDQLIRKVKGAEYLAKHRMKSELCSIDRVIDLWFTAGRLGYQEFFTYCENAFDFEIANDARGFISTICDGYKEVLKIEAGMRSFAEKLNGKSRKEAALSILQAYGDTNRASFVFSILDGKPLDDDKMKKLLYQVLKN